EFPVREIGIDIPKWVTSLEKEHWLKSEVFTSIQNCASGIEKIRQIADSCSRLKNCEYITNADITSVDLGRGKARLRVDLDKTLFCKVIGEKTGIDIADESDMLRIIVELTKMRTEYNKIKSAYDDVMETGYGIVMPSMEELTLEEPKIIKQGSKYGIKLRASAPSIHMLRTNITTELTPIVGSEQQSEDLVMFMLNEFEEDPVKIWESNIFGKSLHELVNEGLHNKLHRMPSDARAKINETIERIINDGCNGLICVIL
ncbi:MAG: stage IV sporulation protein A, partial [Clostridia bacterium]|nr:stage IV sporulation protein A [Clostridia bacterium]